MILYYAWLFYSNTTIIFIAPRRVDALSQLDKKLKQLKLANQKLERNSRGSNAEYRDAAAAATAADFAMVEETTLTRLQQHGGAFPMMAQPSGATRLEAALGVFVFAIAVMQRML